MDIIYVVVSHGTCILRDYTAKGHRGNFQYVAQRILKGIDFRRSEQNRKLTFTNQKYSFHTIVTQGHAFMCMTQVETGKSIPFEFLSLLLKTFHARYPNSMESKDKLSLDYILTKTIEEFAEKNEYERLDSLNRELDDVTENMRLNIETVVERGEKISLLVDKADNLDTSTKRFRSKTRIVKFKIRLEKYKKTVLAALCCMIMIWMMLA